MAKTSLSKKFSLGLLALLFIAAGVNHFINTAFYVSIMPDYLPWHEPLVYWSGVFEIFGGVSIAIPKLRTIAGWGLIFLMIAVFPANVNMVVHPDRFPTLSLWMLVLRLPLQFVLIAWVYWAAIARDKAA